MRGTNTLDFLPLASPWPAPSPSFTLPLEIKSGGIKIKNLRKQTGLYRAFQCLISHVHLCSLSDYALEDSFLSFQAPQHMIPSSINTPTGASVSHAVGGITLPWQAVFLVNSSRHNQLYTVPRLMAPVKGNIILLGIPS